MTMTPEQKIKWAILLRAAELYSYPAPTNITAENIDELFDAAQEENEDSIQDGKSEIRGSGIETDLPCEYSRHYESMSVAAKMPDDTWVGWTYWYGGGKHAEPEAIDWMDSAYNLECTEEEKVVTVRTFTKAEQANHADH